MLALLCPSAAIHARRGKDELEKLQADLEAKRSALEQWCLTSYGEVRVGVGVVLGKRAGWVAQGPRVDH